jgi:hypothetical protein
MVRVFVRFGKVHRYWTLVRGIRVGRRVIQQTVTQLGELDEQGPAARARPSASFDWRARTGAII